MSYTTSRHRSGGNNAFGQSMTLAVWSRAQSGNGLTLLDSYTFRYAPKAMSVTDLGLIRTEPTGGGMVTENGGYWATQISIQGNTGHAAKMVGGKLIDGESMLQNLRELMRDTFGATKVPGTTPQTVRINGYEVPYSNIELHLYNWIGEGSYELKNQEYYKVVPMSQNLFDYKRAAPQQALWNFTLNLIGERISSTYSDQYQNLVKDDEINKSFLFPVQFASTWDYLLSITLDETGRKAFSWFDVVNHYIAETYYQTAQKIGDVKNAIQTAQMHGQAYINIPFFIYEEVNDFITDVQEDLGIIPNSYAASPAKAHYDYATIKQVQESGREMRRLISYPERFTARSTDDRYNYKKYLVKDGDTLKRIATKYRTDWQTIADRNGMKYPFTITEGSELIIPIVKDRERTNTIRTTLEADGVSTATLEERLYGTDIKIDENGEWQVSREDNDIVLAKGAACVIQAVESMEKTVPGEFEDYNWYGNILLTRIGQKIHASEVEVMLIQLRQLIQSHPCIDIVTRGVLTFQNGKMLFDMVFNLINGPTGVKTTARV